MEIIIESIQYMLRESSQNYPSFDPEIIVIQGWDFYKKTIRFSYEKREYILELQKLDLQGETK